MLEFYLFSLVYLFLFWFLFNHCSMEGCPLCGFRHYELVDIGGNEIAATVDDLSQLTFIY